MVSCIKINLVNFVSKIEATDFGNHHLHHQCEFCTILMNAAKAFQGNMIDTNFEFESS